MRHKAQPRPVGAGRHQALAALAQRQHGVISIQELLELGYSRDQVKRMAASGWMHRIDRSVYAVGHTNLSRHGRCLAAVYACGPRAVLSHYSACWLLGLARWEPEPFHVTGPVARRSRLPVRIHRARRLEDEDREVVEEVPVTAVPRTLLDMAATVGERSLARLVERAEELEVFNLGPVESLLDRTWGHHGWGRLRRAIALHQPVPFTRSGFEQRFFEAVLEAGLSRPALNYVEAGFELDVYWPEKRFAVELDTYGTHGTRAAFERDRLRQEDLKLEGIELIRVTDVRFHREPKAVLGRVARLLEQR